MTISTTTQRNDYTGSGNTGPFPFTFKIFRVADLTVTKRSTVGVETTLAYPTDFTVAATAINNPAGGSITLTTALATGEALTLRRIVSLAQETDIRNQGAFYPEIHEDAFDYGRMVDQQQQDEIDHAFHLETTLSLDLYDTTLPAPTPNQVIAWSDDARRLENRSPASTADVLLPGDNRTVATLAEYLAHNAVFNIKDYGAVGDGLTDDTAAFQKALTANAGSVRRIEIPPGTYLVRLDDVAGVSNVAMVGDPRGVTITGGTHSVLNYTTPALSATVSRRIASFSNCTGLTFENITFDGQAGSNRTYAGASYVDQHALMELRSCTDIRWINCHTTDFAGVIPSTASGGLPNSDPFEAQNQGPLFIYGCDGLVIEGGGIPAPSYGEGWVILNTSNGSCTGMTSTAGYADDTTYGLSTPLHWWGPTTENVTIQGCRWTGCRGSALHYGGLQNIAIVDNVVDAGGGLNGTLSGLGYFNDWDQVCSGVILRGNRVINQVDNPYSKIAAVSIGSRPAGVQYRDVSIDGTFCDRVYTGVLAKGCQNLSLLRTIASRVYTPDVPAGSQGYGISIANAQRLILADNTIDESLLAAGTLSNRALYGIAVTDSEDVTIARNRMIDAKTTNLYASVTDAYAIAFTGGTTALRDILTDILWYGYPVTVTGASSGASMTVTDRVITAGDWAAGTASGTIYGVSKIGTFTNGESLTLTVNAGLPTTNAATAGGDATLRSLMNRMVIADNQSVTLSSTTTPVFVQPQGSNVMVGQNNRRQNQHNGILIDPLEVAANVGDASVTLTALSQRTVLFATTLTANRTVTLPSSGLYNGLSFRIVRTGLGAFTVTIGASVFVLPISVASQVTVTYNGTQWILTDFAYLRAQAPAVSTDLGDQDRTLTVGQTQQVVIFNTPLTTNRTATLSTVGAFDGSNFRVVRTAAATGASTLSVGGLKSLAAGQWADVSYDGPTAAWVLTAFGSL